MLIPNWNDVQIERSDNIKWQIISFIVYLYWANVVFVLLDWSLKNPAKQVIQSAIIWCDHQKWACFSICRAYRVTYVTPGNWNTSPHFTLLLRSHNSHSNSSVRAAADTGWKTAVDQTWKWSMNGEELEGKVLTESTSPLCLILFLLESLQADQPARVWNSKPGISSIKYMYCWKPWRGLVWRNPVSGGKKRHLCRDAIKDVHHGSFH